MEPRAPQDVRRSPDDRAPMAALAAKAVVIWAAILVLAMLNGALREFVLMPLLGRTVGLVTSGLLLAALVLGAAWLAVPWFGWQTAPAFIAIGAGWLALTLLFEFSFGLARGKPMAEILSAYSFDGGNLWTLVLIVTAAAPWIAAVARQRVRC